MCGLPAIPLSLAYCPARTHTGRTPMSTPEDETSQIKEAILSGQKIQAIKLYREQTRAGLAEAKDAVEKLEAELRASAPEQFTKPEKKGCTAVLLACAVIGGIVYSFVW
jgi:ribosomal protein L7/L12